MKRFLRKGITKLTAFVLILACAAFFVGVFADALDIVENVDGIYGFESSYLKSREMRGYKHDMRMAIHQSSIEEMVKYLSELEYAEYKLISESGSYGISGNKNIKELPWWFHVKVKRTTKPAETTVVTPYQLTDGMEISSELVQEAPDYYNEWSYDFEDSENSYYEYSNADYCAEFELYAGIKANYYNERESLWISTEGRAIRDVYILIGVGILALALWIYLIAVSGRRPEDDDVHMPAIDRIFVDIIGAATVVLCGVMFVLTGTFLIESVYRGRWDTWLPIAMLLASATVTVFIIGTQSVARNIKNRSFIDRCLCVKFIKFIWRGVKRFWKLLKEAVLFLCGDRLTAIVLAAFLGYTFLITTIFHNPIAVILLAVIACVIAYRWLEQLDKIKTGIFQIRNGNTDYKIEGCTAELLSNAADALNTINEGVKISVERELKAQRMRSELITNVSHDLKTPLTSIISYSALLADMELSPKEANDYAKIIKQKGDSLKKLTSDLFDVSKAQSGTETVNLERIDAALLVRQALAELDNDIKNSSLIFVNSIPDKEVFVRADGKKLSRVFENLLINAVKYSLAGTRVYISLKSTASGAVFEIKNISADPMNFDPEEITERFVRGDASRSTEGSGLGLAIAKSYAELCGGGLEISIDGDLFKASVTLKLQ